MLAQTTFITVKLLLLPFLNVSNQKRKPGIRIKSIITICILNLDNMSTSTSLPFSMTIPKEYEFNQRQTYYDLKVCVLLRNRPRIIKAMKNCLPDLYNNYYLGPAVDSVMWVNGIAVN